MCGAPKKVPILYRSPKFHPYYEMPRQRPKFKILDCKHWILGPKFSLKGGVGLLVFVVVFTFNTFHY